MVVNSAILHFNDGCTGITNVYDCFGITTGRVLQSSICNLTKLVSLTLRKRPQRNQKEEKKLKAAVKGLTDKETLNEGGESYSEGAF